MANKISDHELDRRIADIIYRNWPLLPTQESIAKDLGLSQPIISQRLAFLRKDKNKFPLEICYKFLRNNEMEHMLERKYGINDVIVVNNKNFSEKEGSEEIGKLAVDIIIKKIEKIISSQKEKKCINIVASCGNNILYTLVNLLDELSKTNSDLNISVSFCLTLRSNKIIKLTPIHMAWQLEQKFPNVSILNTFQLPEVVFLNEKLEDLIYHVNNQINSPLLAQVN